MSDADNKKRWKLILNLVTVGALLALCYVLRDQILETIQNATRVNAYALLLIIPIELWNYDAYARMYRYLFGILGTKVRYREMYKVALELNLVNNVFPSGGVSGFSYFGVRMKQLEVSTGKATLVQTMKFILLFTSFEVLIIVGLIMLAIGGQANNFVLLIGGSIATFLFVGTLGAAFIIGSERRINSFFTYITRVVNRVIHVVRPKHPETINIARVQATFKDLHENYIIIRSDYKQLLGPALCALLANTTEIAAIYVVYIAFGQWVNPGAVILAYAVANFAGMISVLPGGVGIYEALMTGTLAAAGVPASVSIPVTVMYRVINITLQLIPGYYFYHKALRHEGPPKPA
ncbi:MAG: Flippase-like protein [Patescibacteria group bacterium]|nr:Flippase-like protein [Patescibacteria group bacterium]